MIKNKKDIFVVGYPRCGERFLSHNYGNLTGTYADISHDINFIENNPTPIVAVVRDPLDSLTSSLAMGFYQQKEVYDYTKGPAIDLSIYRYIRFYEKLLTLDNIIFVDFKDVISKIIPVIKYLANEFNHNYEYGKIASQQEIFELSPKESLYIPTSKNLPGYQEMYNDFKAKDLSRVYDLYRQSLDRCIIISNEEWVDWTGSHG